MTSKDWTPQLTERFVPDRHPVVGTALLGFENAIVGAVVLTFTVVVSLLVLEVIDDLDEPLGGAWAISSAALARIRFGLRTPPPRTK
jgi:hypothetical protein